MSSTWSRWSAGGLTPAEQQLSALPRPGQAQPQQSPYATATPYGQSSGQQGGTPQSGGYTAYAPQQQTGGFGAYAPQLGYAPQQSYAPPMSYGGQMGGFSQGVPSFQFRATDFMGNTYGNPGAFTAQQGAMAQALNQQRAGQVESQNFGALNPFAAYQQGQQMLQGGFTNPFAQGVSQQQMTPAPTYAGPTGIPGLRRAQQSPEPPPPAPALPTPSPDPAPVASAANPLREYYAALGLNEFGRPPMIGGAAPTLSAGRPSPAPAPTPEPTRQVQPPDTQFPDLANMFNAGSSAGYVDALLGRLQGFGQPQLTSPTSQSGAPLGPVSAAPIPSGPPATNQEVPDEYREPDGDLSAPPPSEPAGGPMVAPEVVDSLIGRLQGQGAADARQQGGQAAPERNDAYLVAQSPNYATYLAQRRSRPAGSGQPAWNAEPLSEEQYRQQRTEVLQSQGHSARDLQYYLGQMGLSGEAGTGEFSGGDYRLQQRVSRERWEEEARRDREGPETTRPNRLADVRETIANARNRSVRQKPVSAPRPAPPPNKPARRQMAASRPPGPMSKALAAAQGWQRQLDGSYARPGVSLSTMRGPNRRQPQTINWGSMTPEELAGVRSPYLGGKWPQTINWGSG